EDMAFSRSVDELDLILTKGAATLSTDISRDYAEWLWLRQMAEPLAELRAVNAIAASLGRVEIGFSLRRMRMAGDECDDGAIAVRLLGQSPKSRRHRVPVRAAQSANEIEAGSLGGCLGFEPRCEEEELGSGIVSPRLHDFMTGGRECLLGVAKHHATVP